MSILDYFVRRNDPSANVAKDRLQIVIAHQRKSCSQNMNMLMRNLRREITTVIAKYIQVEDEKISVNLDKTGNNSVLELNVILPEEVE